MAYLLNGRNRTTTARGFDPGILFSDTLKYSASEYEKKAGLVARLPRQPLKNRFRWDKVACNVAFAQRLPGRFVALARQLLANATAC